MTTKMKIFLFLVVAPLFAATLIGIQIYYQVELKTYDGPTKYFTINPGEGFSRINYRLRKEKLIDNINLFHKYAKLTGVIKKFKAGKYEIKTGSNMTAIMNTLLYGSAYTQKVVIAEGKNLFEIASIMEKNGIANAKQFIKITKNKKFTKSFNIPSTRLEGYLYPDTYRFMKNTPVKTIVNKLIRTFKKRTKNLELTTHPTLNSHQIITLASIVEKETGASFERPSIARVFLNRLKKGMRLQSDPTTIYGFYENFSGNLKKKHLQTKTPYNTYRIKGLPVGPICNPGIESIKAVLNPAEHNYLYFVSKNDGTHIFTEKYKDHLEAVRKFQKSRTYRKNRSWRDLKNRK